MIVWLNGELTEASATSIAITDKGFLIGDGVFETLRSYGGKPFALADHIRRLGHSANRSGIVLENVDQLRDAVGAVLTANKLRDARLRITVTSGSGPAGLERGNSGQTQLVTASELSSWPPTAKALISPWPKNEHGPLAGVKSTSNAENIVKLAYAKKHHVDELISLNTAGNLCEGTTSNVLTVDERGITTPPLSAGCLSGVTRSHLITFAAAQGVEIKEMNSSKQQLYNAHEILLTSSTRIIQPIIELDGKPVGSGKPGPTAKKLTAFFLDGIKQELRL